MPETQMYMFVSFYMSELLDDDKFQGTAIWQVTFGDLAEERFFCLSLLLVLTLLSHITQKCFSVQFTNECVKEATGE